MADLVEGVVAVIPRDGKWLATRRAADIAFGGWWCFPGGAVETGEQPAEAVIREVREEVGLTVAPERQIWRWEDPDDGLVLYWWLTRLTDAGAEVIANPDEVAEVRWVRPADFLRLEPILESNTAFLRESAFAAANPQ
jgi:mutator protein MutT